MVSSVRIVIVEDELMIRSMLRLFCETEPTWHVVGEAGDCEGARSIVEAMQPDIVLLDLGLAGENGLDCLPHLKRLGAKSVVVLTGNEDPVLHARARELGASQLLRKGDPSETILEALREEASEIASDFYRTSSKDSELPTKSLDNRERRIIELLAAGCKDSEIANELQLPLSVLQHILNTIYYKLDVADRIELVVYAFRHRLVLDEP